MQDWNEHDLPFRVFTFMISPIQIPLLLEQLTIPDLAHRAVLVDIAFGLNVFQVTLLTQQPPGQRFLNGFGVPKQEPATARPDPK